MYKKIEIKENDQKINILINLHEISMIHPSNEGTIIFTNGQYVNSTIGFVEFENMLKERNLL